MTVKCQQNIVQFQVPISVYVRKHQEMETNEPVNDSVRMEVFKCEEDFRCVELGLPQRKLFALDVQHQIASTDVFHDKVYTSLRLEAGVKSE